MQKKHMERCLFALIVLLIFAQTILLRHHRICAVLP